ncbi:LysR substrate-binding domain-containing protein [Sphingomonas sp. TREG-RG-20F-R18-01]|uniref:LysR substrate-binding domain-containing protein n=1 Tax=Sphingomonas sp. TREG-RG-20F-R18-01 TaxID=2914982 RepID=UPI001F5A0ADB|nr:LysR substrate-binding domain-containing protein [Sphingomonas sp. TREG-RG-20F-R18-01]
MAVNHQHLRAFHAIALEGGVSRAARRLNVSQPTLSQQLKALEARYGVMLFESRKVPLSLTPAGRDLLALTHKLFATASDIDEILGETAEMTGGMLRLGSDNPYYVAKMVQLLRRDHPQTKVQVRMGNARDVMRWLGEAHVDAALASDPPGDANFSYEPLASETLACALPRDHALAALENVPITAFADETLLLRESSSKTRAFTERALVDAGIEPRATIELQTRETIREGIALGLGISAFFESECPPDGRIVYRALGTGERSYQLRSYLVCQSDRRRSALMRALRSTVAEMQGTV